MQNCSENHQTKDKSAISMSKELIDLSAVLQSIEDIEVEESYPENEPIIEQKQVFDIDEFTNSVAKLNCGQKYLKLISELNIVIQGKHHFAIVKSKPGYAKTTIIRELFRKHKMEEGKNFIIISGFITTKRLFEKLYEYREKGMVIVFDDCDSVFDDLKAANLLKSATDDKQVRRICYETTVKGKGTPQEYNFEAGVIILTNTALGKKNLALKDRGFYIELELTTREKIEYIQKFLLKDDTDQFVYDQLRDEANRYELEFSFRTFKQLKLRSIHLKESLPQALKELRVNQQEDSSKDILRQIMAEFPYNKKGWINHFTERTGKKERRFYDLKKEILNDLKFSPTPKATTPKKGIEWTDETWNPMRGCSKISPGCKNCYAETFAKRFEGVKGNAYEKGFIPRVAPDLLDQPKKWKKPKKILVNSMSDFFHESFTVEYLTEVCEVMKSCPQHTFQVLTKRASRLHYLLNNDLKEYAGLRNVWWGVSVEDQRYGVPRIELLRDTPAKVKFLSCEPLLENLGELNLKDIDWVIVGGESGTNFRKMDEAWVQSVLRQCEEQKSAFFFKQWAGRSPKKLGRLLNGREYNNFPQMADFTSSNAAENCSRIYIDTEVEE